MPRRWSGSKTGSAAEIHRPSEEEREVLTDGGIEHARLLMSRASAIGAREWAVVEDEQSAGSGVAEGGREGTAAGEEMTVEDEVVGSGTSVEEPGGAVVRSMPGFVNAGVCGDALAGNADDSMQGFVNPVPSDAAGLSSKRERFASVPASITYASQASQISSITSSSSKSHILVKNRCRVRRATLVSRAQAHTERATRLSANSVGSNMKCRFLVRQAQIKLYGFAYARFAHAMASRWPVVT